MSRTMCSAVVWLLLSLPLNPIISLIEKSLKTFAKERGIGGEFRGSSFFLAEKNEDCFFYKSVKETALI